MTSGLGRGIDKSLSDIEEEKARDGDKRKDVEIELTPDEEMELQERVDRLIATATLAEGGRAQDGQIILDEGLYHELWHWLLDKGFVPEDFSQGLAILGKQSLDYHAKKEVEAYLKRIWHIGGPTVETMGETGPNHDPTGKGIWTKQYLDAWLRLQKGEPIPDGPAYDVARNSIKYWNSKVAT